MNSYAVIMVWDIKSNAHVYKTTAASFSIRSDVQDIELLRDCFGDALRKTIETLKVEYGPGAEITLLSHSITKM